MTHNPLAQALSIGNHLDFVLHVVPHEREISKTCKILKFLYSDHFKIIEFPGWDCAPYERISPGILSLSIRMYTLRSLIQSTSKTILVTSVSSLMQKIPPKQAIEQALLNVHRGAKAVRPKVIEFLKYNGYQRSPVAEHEGEFAVRGGVIDIIPAKEEFGYRLDFFGEDLESIKLYNTRTQISFGSQDALILGAMNELILDAARKSTFKHKYRQHFGIQEDSIYNAVMEERKNAGIEHFLPLFYDELFSIFDYIPQQAHVLLSSEAHERLKDMWYEINTNYKARLTWLKKSEELKILPPEALYLNMDKIEDHLEQYPQLDAKGDYFTERQISSPKESIEILHACIKSRQKALVACGSSITKDRITKLLKKEGIKNFETNTLKNIMDSKKSAIAIAILPIETGTTLQNIKILSDQEILGAKLNTDIATDSQDINKFFSEVNNISPNDLVVHTEHGIGRFSGIETLEVSKVPRDFVKLIYKDGDKLYLPVENLDLIYKYGRDEILDLDKLGTKSWGNKKNKLRQKIKLAAEQLLDIAAEREMAHASIIEPTDQIYHECCRKFKYIETADQAKAIEEVLKDLNSGKPMDRLICGDAGFGKTEVAIRAASATVSNNAPYQVAIVVPTTLLARQHYQTFKDRFADLPIKVEQLSKFIYGKAAKDIKLRVKQGDVDIVVGTHALLAKDIEFKNLGLIILDEEQHFGVAQKERLKKFKANTHILTLSATPIPRTLQMSISGIKELSIIATPPKNRLPVKTYVMPYDGLTIRDAIMREYSRGGKTFYVTPRVSYLDAIEHTLGKIIPEVKVVKAHGSMTSTQLDKIMNDFYDGKYDVLISTTIVESGLDMPAANTIIVDKADMFGLAQLYQLRGRVGRGSVPAYAYLTFSRHKKLSREAGKRMETIQTIKGTGGGFIVASSDLDIRGYGNLLGEEQSGHIKEVGLELYQRMLKQLIAELKGEKQETDWSPILNLGVSVMIPENYIPDASLRLGIYRRIAAFTSTAELDDFIPELQDRFGNLPTSVSNLMTVTKVRILAKACNIIKIDRGEKAVVFTFKNGTPDNPEIIMNFITQNPGQAKLKGEEKMLVFIEQNQDISYIYSILKQLA